MGGKVGAPLPARMVKEEEKKEKRPLMEMVDILEKILVDEGFDARDVLMILRDLENRAIIAMTLANVKP